MAQTTVTQLTVAEFASSLKMPAEALLEHLKKAGIAKNSAGDSLTEQDKSRLLDFLRRAHGATEAKTKITLTRRETSLTTCRAPKCLFRLRTSMAYSGEETEPGECSKGGLASVMARSRSR